MCCGGSWLSAIAGGEMNGLHFPNSSNETEEEGTTQSPDQVGNDYCDLQVRTETQLQRNLQRKHIISMGR
jgi:hypothetical protein